MDHRHMADQHLLADQRGMALGFARLGRIAVHAAAVLDVATLADAIAVHIAPDNACMPDARPRPALDIDAKPRPGTNDRGWLERGTPDEQRMGWHTFHSPIFYSYNKR